MGAVEQVGRARCARWLMLLLALWAAAPRAAAQSATPLRSAAAVAYDAAGDLFLADPLSHQVVEATLGGRLLVVAGTGAQGFSGDGAAAVSAELNEPRGLAMGADNSLYIADTGNNRIRVVTPDGMIRTVAGTGVPGRSGDGGPAAAAQLFTPTALALDSAGRLIFCDTGNHQVRRITAGTIAAIAGTGLQGTGGDGGQATLAALNGPEGLAVAADGTVFVADTRNHRIRRISSDGVIGTVAGSGVSGFAGDGGPGVLAGLSSPRGLALQPDGTLLIADTGNERVRSLSPAGVITTVAGNGIEGRSAEGASATSAALQGPEAVAMSPLGYVIFADNRGGTARALAGQLALYQPAALVNGRTTGLTTTAAAHQNYGQGSLAASVQGSAGVPLGQVQLTQAGTVLRASSLTAGGTASFDLSALQAGSQQLALHYTGDGLNPAADGATVQVQVAPLVLTAIANPAATSYGAPVPSLSGVVSGLLPQDVSRVQTSFVTAAGEMPTPGLYPIAAALTGQGSPNYTIVMSPTSGQLQVTRAGATVTMGDVGPSYAGVPLTLQAAVKPPQRGQPTGTVQFLDGGTVVASVQLLGGIATASYAAPPTGTRNLSAQYLGDANFLPGTSGQVAVTTAPMPDFTIATNGASSASIAAGGAASYTLLVSGQPGPFTGAIGFSASGLPPGASLVFSPPQVVPGNGSAMVTVTVQTAAVQASAARSARPGMFVLCAVGGMFLVRGRRQPAWRVLGALAFALLVAGCGARTVGEGPGGVLAASYPLQVTGTSTNLVGAVVTHTAQLTLTINGAAP